MTTATTNATTYSIMATGTLWSTYFIPMSLELQNSAMYADLRVPLQKRFDNARNAPQYLDVAVIQNNIVHMPRFFPIVHCGIDIASVASDQRLKGRPLAENPLLNVSVTLKPLQQDATTATITQLQQVGGAMLVLPCGFGKTVCALYIAFHIGRKTLVLVHTEALLEQWEQRIKQFWSGARIGRIQKNTVDYENKDVVVALIQSVARRNYTPQTLQDFGTVIVDEAHHIAAPFFCKALTKLPAKYVLGLSATPDRVDGLGKILPWFLGNVAFTATRPPDNTVCVHTAAYFDGDQSEILMRNRKLNLSAMLTRLTIDATRNERIVQLLKKLVCEERQVLVLSDRRDHVLYLTSLFDQAGAIVGGMKTAHRTVNLEAQLLFSTYAYASEGMDIPRLNTLVFATPRSNIEQAIGRILRKSQTKHAPQIIDIVDKFSIFIAMAHKRQAFYTAAGYAHESYELCAQDSMPPQNFT